MASLLLGPAGLCRATGNRAYGVGQNYLFFLAFLSVAALNEGCRSGKNIGGMKIVIDGENQL
jgi:hypothetical protein